MTIVLRSSLNRPLNWDELDGNFEEVSNQTSLAQQSAAIAQQAADSVSSVLVTASGYASEAAASASEAQDTADDVEQVASGVNLVLSSSIRAPAGETLSALPDKTSRISAFPSFDEAGNLKVTFLSSLPSLDQTGKIPLTQIPNLKTDTVYTVQDSPSGIISRSLTDIHGELMSVKDFGAKGDNSTDDTLAFQKAATWAASKPFGATLYVPSGIYILSSAISWQGGNVTWTSEAVNNVLLSWKSSSTSGGFIAGSTTPVKRVKITGIQFATNAVLPNSAIRITSDGSSPKSVVLREISAYGGSVSGTVSAGYWRDGLAYLIDPVYPVLDDCFFFGIGGTPSVSNVTNITSCFTIISKNIPVFFTNLFNCFGNGANVGLLLVTQHEAGIEGTVVDSCNFNSCNTGIYGDATASGNANYYPPQIFIQNSQIEYLQRGININHYGKVIVSGSLIYADPTANVALTHILLTDVESADISHNYMESRPVHTNVDGVLVNGNSINVRVKENQIAVPSGKFGVVFAGSVSNSVQSANLILGGMSYSNTSTNKSTNTAESYVSGGQYSHQTGGYVEKFGSLVVTLGSGGSFTVTFPAAYSNNNLTVIPSNGNSAAGAESVLLTTKNLTGFTGVFVNGTSGSNRQLNYISKGN